MPMLPELIADIGKPATAIVQVHVEASEVADHEEVLVGVVIEVDQ